MTPHEQPTLTHYDGRLLSAWWVYSPDSKAGRYRVWADSAEAARAKVESCGKRVSKVEPGEPLV